MRILLLALDAGESTTPCLSTAPTDPFGLPVAVILTVTTHEMHTTPIGCVQVWRRPGRRFVLVEVLDDRRQLLGCEN